MSSVITQEIHILKTIFGENVIDSVINTIESEVKNAPNKIDENTKISNALKMFTDLIYSDDGTKRLISMEQFGSIYICKVIDYTSSKPYVYLAYSLYDIIETFNKSDNSLKVPYVRIHESATNDDYSVMIVDYPQNYNDENCFNPEDEKALNEIGKYKICFDNDDRPCVDLICNPHIISVSNPYVRTTPIKISESICGACEFVFDEKNKITIQYCEPNDEPPMSIADIFEQIDKIYLNNMIGSKTLLGLTLDGSDTLYTLDELKTLYTTNVFRVFNVIIKDCVVVETQYLNDNLNPINILVESNTKTVREIFEELDLQKLVEENTPLGEMLDSISVVSIDESNPKSYGIDDIIDTNTKIEVKLKDKPKVFVAAQAVGNDNPLKIIISPYTKTLEQVLNGFVFKSFLKSTCPAGKKVLNHAITAKTYDETDPVVYSLNDLIEENCFVTIPYGEDTDIHVGDTYDFTSYGKESEDPLGTGVAKITKINSDNTIIEVIENSISGFVGKTYKVQSIKYDTDVKYELYDAETNEDTGMKVTITLKEAKYPTNGNGTTTSTGKELEGVEIAPKIFNVADYVVKPTEDTSADNSEGVENGEEH